MLDASAAVNLLLGTDRASGIAQVPGTVNEAHAPELIDPEVIAVVRLSALCGWLAVEAGARAVDELGELALVRHRHVALRRRAWRLRDRCGGYDGCYIALAKTLGAQLLTTHAGPGRAARGLVDVLATR